MKPQVAILGASKNPERYSYLARQMLLENGYDPILVSPKPEDFPEAQVVATLEDIKVPVDTLTMYVGPARSTQLAEAIRKLRPRRVIFNPGSENAPLQDQLKSDGVRVIEACTLVLLRTAQFEKA